MFKGGHVFLHGKAANQGVGRGEEFLGIYVDRCTLIFYERQIFPEGSECVFHA